MISRRPILREQAAFDTALAALDLFDLRRQRSGARGAGSRASAWPTSWQAFRRKPAPAHRPARP
jgi:hypothetical protein